MAKYVDAFTLFTGFPRFVFCLRVFTRYSRNKLQEFSYLSLANPTDVFLRTSSANSNSSVPISTSNTDGASSSTQPTESSGLQSTRAILQQFGSDGRFQLFVSFIKPYNVVTSSTIGCWMKTVLEQAGIDTQFFSAHSLDVPQLAKQLRDLQQML